LKITITDPPRIFHVGIDKSIQVSDCGRICLEPGEQVTFVTAEGKEHDFAAKSWGFYATPSVNGRLAKQGFKTALVKNSFGKYYIMVVDSDRMEQFLKYLRAEKQEIVEWLDER
jgi:hypothetical protein